MHDASLNKKRRVRFAQKYREWLETLQCLLKTAGSNSWIYKEGKDRNVYVLETVCADLHFDFDPLNLSTEQQKLLTYEDSLMQKVAFPEMESAFTFSWSKKIAPK